MDKHKRIKKVLLTCAAGSAVQYLAKRLKKRYRPLLADATDQRVIAAHLRLPFIRLPFGDAPDYVPAVRRYALARGIDLVVPGADEEILPLAAVSGINGFPLVLAPGLEFSRIALDKKRTAQVLHGLGISGLPVYETEPAIRFPAVVKPRQGRGSRGVHVVSNREQYDGYLKLYGRKFSDLAVEPEIGGEEYTVSVLVNDRNRLLGVVPKRVILKKGITRIAVSERNKRIERACERIVAELRPAGPFNVQLKLKGGKVYIFEINPRLSTTSVLTDRCFANEVDMYVRHLGSENTPAPPPVREGIYLYRYDENYFLSGKSFSRE